MFKGWQVKALGSKPTADQLASIHNLGARPGKQALAIAMALRDSGVTGSQIVMACGAPQLNKLRGFITDSMLKRIATPPDAVGHTVYRVELTAKGKKRIESAEKRAADAAAAGADTGDKPKAKKAKGTGNRVTKARKATVTHNEAVQGSELASGAVENQPQA